MHRRLDKLSERLFICAIVSVSVYLAAAAATALGAMSHGLLNEIARIASFLGVAFPTFGAGRAGVRYFGDFERFAAISEVTAEKLDTVTPGSGCCCLPRMGHTLSYAQDRRTGARDRRNRGEEVENWQAVFGGRRRSPCRCEGAGEGGMAWRAN